MFSQISRADISECRAVKTEHLVARTFFSVLSVSRTFTAYDRNQETPPVLLRKEDCCLAIWLNQLLSHKMDAKQKQMPSS